MTATSSLAARPVRRITRLSEIAGGYRAVLSDIWGVVHNGLSAWPGACAALAAMREAGAPVILISNAPRPGRAVVGLLDELGVQREAYDGIITSGDIVRDDLSRMAQASVFHLGPERDLGIFEGLDIRLADAGSAEVIVNTGLYDDETETPEDYRALLEPLAARGATMICANPDIQVERGERLVYCAGAVAELYRTMGGEVIWAGKPHPPIYEAALAEAERVAGRSFKPGEVLAIGDSVRTDLEGARRMGLDALFVASGIHGAETGRGEELNLEVLAEMFAKAGVTPVGATASLEP